MIIHFACILYNVLKIHLIIYEDAIFYYYLKNFQSTQYFIVNLTADFNLKCEVMFILLVKTNAKHCCENKFLNNHFGENSILKISYNVQRINFLSTWNALKLRKCFACCQTAAPLIYACPLLVH